MIVIACSKLWDPKVPLKVERHTGRHVKIILGKEELTYEKLKMLDPSYVFFPHWSYVIPKEIYENFECIIFHMTDLPYGRGGSPLQNLIMRGHTETKISALKCVKELDAGPIYLKRELSLEGSAHEIYKSATEIMISMIDDIVKNKRKPTPQEGESVVFKRRTPKQSDLSLADTPDQSYDMIRMLDAPGYPYAFLETSNLRLEFSDAELAEDGTIARVKITRKVDD